MLGKLFATLTVVVSVLTCALMLQVAADAHASEGQEVEIENPGQNLVTGENTLSVRVHVPNGLVMLCDNVWDISFSADGHVQIPDVYLSRHVGSTPSCQTANDCNNAGWEAQVFEGLAPNHEYGIDIAFCFEGTALPQNTYHALCEINEFAIFCDTVVGFFAPANGWIEVEGQLNLGAPPGIMHASVLMSSRLWSGDQLAGSL